MATVVLHEGPLSGDPPFSIPFDLPAPNAPFTYQGNLFSVDHFLQANMDFAGALDDVVTKRYVVLPGALVGPPHSRLMAATRKVAGKRLPAWRVILGALAAFAGLATLPWGFVLLLPGLWLLFPPIKRKVAESRLGTVTAHLGSRVVGPGDPLQVRLQIKPNSQASINKASVEMRAQEISVWTSGDDRKVHRRVAYSQETPITSASILEAGASRVFAAAVPVPETAGHTFVSEDNKLVWEAVVRVDIPNWPDWEKVFPILVWPAPGQIRRPEAPALPPEEREARVWEVDPSEAGVHPHRQPSGHEDGQVVPDPGLPVVKELQDLDAFLDGLLGQKIEGLSETPTEEPTGDRGGRAPWEPARKYPWEAGATPLEELHGKTESESQVESPEEVPPPPPEDVTEEPRPQSPEGLAEEPALEPLEGILEEPVLGPLEGLSEEPAPEPTEEPPSEPAPVSQPPAAGAMESGLPRAVQAILEESIIGGTRDELITGLKGTTHRFQLTVGKVERTFAMYSDPDFRNGRTVSGKIHGSEVSVSIWFPESRNAEVDGFEEGGTYSLVGTVAEWDRLRARPNLKAESP
jgi:hypothetical protein